jgi:beta-lactam-binding protein with PASTA domain
MVQVPRLQGESLAQIRDKYPDFVIVEGDSAFSSVYEKGQIMTQNPKSGIRVAKGSTITVVVSLGREEEVKKTMTSLVGLTEAAARKFLDDMDMDLVIRVQQEVTNDVAPGQVVRTDPAPEETLTEGQTVTLYIAKEKNVKKAPMPSVVGLHKTVADTVLQGSDFTNFRFEPVDSDKVENMVVGQSVPEDEMTALDQEIIIYISKGPAVPPTTMVTQPSDPTEGSDPVVTESVRFNLPEGRPRAYYLRIVQGDLVVQEDILIQPDQTTFSLRLSGTGITEFKLYIDGEFYRSAIWDFSANE